MSLKEARMRAGYTIDALARAARVHRQYILQLEAGERHPSRETLRHLADILNYPRLEEEYFTREDAQDVRSEPTLVTAVKRLLKKMGIS
jgi:transcriptional regulator with XRE-family HTH domain